MRVVNEKKTLQEHDGDNISEPVPVLDDEALAVIQHTLDSPNFLSPYAALYYPRKTWSYILQHPTLQPSEKHHVLVGIARTLLRQKGPKEIDVSALSAAIQNVHPQAAPFSS